jgi:asparagine synthase (glutamine-hydrolysing)
MCGIAGIFAYRSSAPVVNRNELRRIRDHMAARGPDGKGEWLSESGRIGLGHRRLSIIDLSERAAQPMVSADRRQVVTFNGEIYNYRELRIELEAVGRRFRSDSDTEVLLQLYAEKGESMLRELRGMFAFALWDERKGSLLLARDPYGIKPLYYADDGATLRFASQVKALGSGGAVSAEPSPAGVVGFYLLGSVPEPHTLYRDIRSLEAGASVWITPSGVQEPARYFSLPAVWKQADHCRLRPLAETQEAVREALLESVAYHRVADVPVGAFLSAGIDSGALVGLLQESASRNRAPGGGSAHPLATVTLAFEEFRGRGEDEAPIAAQVAAYYGAGHQTYTVTESEFREDLPRIFEAMDQPTVDGINTWFVSKAAKQAGLKVAVSGLGGDELFGGYPSFSDIPRWVRLLWLPACVPGLGELAALLHEVFSPLFSFWSPKAAGMIRYGGTYSGAYLLRRGIFLPHEIKKLMDPETASEGLRSLGIEQLIDQAASPTPSRPFSRIAAMEGGLYMRNQLLRDTDWASMAHSLEVRVPLVDAWLTRRLAPWLAAAGDRSRKQLLAMAPRPALPEAVTSRSKTGFATPISTWLSNSVPIPASAGSGSPQGGKAPWTRRWATAVAARGGFDNLRPLL